MQKVQINVGVTLAEAGGWQVVVRRIENDGAPEWIEGFKIYRWRWTASRAANAVKRSTGWQRG